MFLEAAADHAPDAPAAGASGNDTDRYDLSADKTADILAQAATTDRARVVEIARQAIARHRAITSATA